MPSWWWGPGRWDVATIGRYVRYAGTDAVMVADPKLRFSTGDRHVGPTTGCRRASRDRRPR